MATYYYAAFQNSIRDNLEDATKTFNTILDHFSPMFYELSGMLMYFDKDVVQEWIREHPTDPMYTYPMAGMSMVALRFSYLLTSYT
jgi:hypothetical protein